MSWGEVRLANLAAALALVLLVWLASLPLRDASIMDIFWGLGFVALAWLSLILATERPARGWLVATLTTIWGLRLAGYLACRRRGQAEDRRYRAVRERYGQRFWIISLPLVFGLQAVLIWIVGLPLSAAAFSARPLGWLDGLGAALWAIGFFFEAVGDYQLAAFKAKPENRGRVLDRGLWRYTRHPNYFGDFLVWWGLYAIAAAGNAPWWVVISPLLMSLLLLRVSGVTLLEKSFSERNRDYGDYIARTSVFVPWPPRRTP
jgi:steroid 5-alpha reductase family enzyme